MITSVQCRAARALLDWPRERLASELRIGLRSIVDFERSARAPRYVTLDALRRALEKAGVEFIAENGGGPGVRITKSTKGARKSHGKSTRSKTKFLPCRRQRSPAQKQA